MLRADIFQCNSECVLSDALPPAGLYPKQYHQLGPKCSKAQDLGGHFVVLELATQPEDLNNHVYKFLIINLVFLYRQSLAGFLPLENSADPVPC